MSPRSIDTHKADCGCPACQGRRGEREARSPVLSTRVAPDVHAWLQARPEGPRRWIESAARQAMASDLEEGSPEWHEQRLADRGPGYAS